MKQALPSIPPEIKERLEKKGFVPYKHEPLHDFLNPHSNLFAATNLVILGISLIGRRAATKGHTPRFLWSTAAVGVPVSTLISNAKIDKFEDYGGHRKNLEERLEFSPITRRAWERAKKINDEYQEGLRQEIAQLEKKLAA